MHPVFVLALLNCASALDECKASECQGDQSVSLLAIGRRSTKEAGKARESLSKANAAVMSLLEKTEGVDLTAEQQSAVDAIKALINEILSHATTQTQTDKDDLQASADVVALCGTVTTTSLNGNVKVEEDAADAKRGVHNTCRDSEAALNIDLGTKCSTYDAHRTNIANEAPPCVATNLDEDHLRAADGSADKQEMESCVVLVHTWSVAFVALYEPCNDARDAHAPVKAVCDSDQGVFEGKFCEFKIVKNDACQAQTDCRAGAVAGFDTAVANVATAEAARKADWVAGSRILCYLDVFSVAKDGRQARLDACRAETHSTTALDITAPTAAGAVTCNAVVSYPCLEGWLNAEYMANNWYQQAPPTGCTAC